MNDNEKRTVSDYEVKTEISIGGREYIIGENLSKKDVTYMMCEGYCGNDFGIQVYEKMVGSNDYLEIFCEFANRITEAQKRLVAERESNNLTLCPLSEKDCLPNGKDKDLSGEILIIKQSSLSPEFRSAESQLVVADFGNGCNPNGLGSSVYCTELFSGKKMKYSKHSIAGIADQTKLPTWTREKIEQYRQSLREAEKASEKPSVLTEIA